MLKFIVVLLCIYEVIAILSAQVPTLTALSHRYVVIGVILSVVLVWHLLIEPFYKA